MNDKVKEYFQDHKDSIEVFQTNDGYLFHKDYDAITHARSLVNKEVVRHAVADFKVMPQGTIENGVASIALPETGVNAIAPIVAEEDGTVISPAVGEFSTAPVAAVQTVLPDNVVIDPGTVELPALEPAEEVAPVIDPLQVDEQEMAAKEVELPALDAEEASKAVKAQKAENTSEEKAGKAPAKPAGKKPAAKS